MAAQSGLLSPVEYAFLIGWKTWWALGAPRYKNQILLQKPNIYPTESVQQ